MTRTSFGDQLAQMWHTRPVRLPRQGPVAGVAAGFGLRYGVDPVLVRVAFVVSTIFGGAGIVLYLLAWLLLSSAGDESSAAESLAGRGTSSHSPTKTVVLIVGLAIAVSTMGPVGLGLGGSGVISMAFLLAGWWLLYLRHPELPTGYDRFLAEPVAGGLGYAGYPATGYGTYAGDPLYTPYTKLPDEYVPAPPTAPAEPAPFQRADTAATESTPFQQGDTESAPIRRVDTANTEVLAADTDTAVLSVDTDTDTAVLSIDTDSAVLPADSDIAALSADTDTVALRKDPGPREAPAATEPGDGTERTDGTDLQARPGDVTSQEPGTPAHPRTPEPDPADAGTRDPDAEMPRDAEGSALAPTGADLARPAEPDAPGTTSLEKVARDLAASESAPRADLGKPPHTVAPRTMAQVPPGWDPLGVAPLAWELPAPAGPRTMVAPPPPPPRPRSRFTPVVLGLAILAAAVAGGVAAAGADWMTPVRIAAVALFVLCAGLVVGAFRRRGGGLVIAAVPLAGFVVLASVVGPVDISENNVGDRQWAPATVAELQPRYELAVGSAELDLRGLKLTESRAVTVAVNVGDSLVLLPPDMTVRTTCDVRVGDQRCQEGLTGPQTPGAPVLDLTVETKMGDVEVRRG
ncbi:PspC domain-containing protein [Nocardia thailandica]|uniref:PspC domain-containing protein n=1 Tax=Nocardia thailandica TaxID=257275 RepID=UPI00278BD3EE|nr:PspC domain-containing protein [Nocardia thailandica]